MQNSRLIIPGNAAPYLQRMRSKTRSFRKFRKPRRILFSRFLPLRGCHFAPYPKPKTRRWKPRDFLWGILIKLWGILIKLRGFPSSSFRFGVQCKNETSGLEKLGVWSKYVKTILLLTELEVSARIYCPSVGKAKGNVFLHWPTNSVNKSFIALLTNPNNFIKK